MGKSKKKKRVDVASTSNKNSVKNTSNSNLENKPDTEGSVSEYNTTANSSSDIDVVSSESVVSDPISEVVSDPVSDREIKSSNSGKCTLYQETRPRESSRSIDKSEGKHGKTNIGESSNNPSRSHSKEDKHKRNEDSHGKQSRSSTSGYHQDIKKDYRYEKSNRSGDHDYRKNKTSSPDCGSYGSNSWRQRKIPDQEQSDSKQFVERKANYGENAEVNPRLYNNSKFRNNSNDRSRARSWSRPDEEFTKFEATYIRHKDVDIDYKVVQEIEGDLFTASIEYSLGHCVAEDMNMGSGIAVSFRRDFKRVDELLDQRKTQGNVAILEDRGRFIYYLVTKRASSGKPTYYTLWSSLHKMKDHIIANNVKKLALPRIGCGLDGLEWKYVKNMLEYIFQSIDIEIVIYNFQQDSSFPSQGKSRKCNVVNTAKLLSEIESYTIMVYFGSEDGHETQEIKDLSEKFPFIRNLYRSATRVIDGYVFTERHTANYLFYGCIVRKKHTDPFSFPAFQQCLRRIQQRNRKDQYEYIAFQAFLEDGSTMIVSKIVNLMRHALTGVDIYVCWPDNLSKYMPLNNQ